MQIYIDTNEGEKLIHFSTEPYKPTKDANKWTGVVADDKATSISFVLIHEQITNLQISDNITTNAIVLEKRLSEMITEYQNQLKDGFENEDDTINTDEIILNPYNPDDIKVRPSTYTVTDLFSKMNKEDIDLSPDFQRHIVWTNTQKSRLIESILLGIPLPVFYFAQDKENVLHVVDGLQRLSTIRDFLKNKFHLTNLEHLQICEKKYFGISAGINDRVSENIDNKKVLERRFQRRIEDTQLTANIIEASSPAKVKYDIFKRINEAGKPLNNQEIRNSLANKITRKLLQELSQSENFKKTTGGINDIRMGAQEIVLRFIGFYLNLKKGYKNLEYRGDMNEFLDRVNDEMNKATPQLEKEIKDAFYKSMENSNHLFGEFSFRKYTIEQIQENKKQLLNKALFVTWSVVLTDYDFNIIKNKFKHKEFAVFLAKELKKNEPYFNGISYKSSDRLILGKSFEFAQELINRKLL
jgi:hypothetical protein